MCEPSRRCLDEASGPDAESQLPNGLRRLAAFALVGASLGCGDDTRSVVEPFSGCLGAVRDPEEEWCARSRAGSTAPLILESMVIFGSNEGEVFALDRKTGALRWTQRIGTGGINGHRVHLAAGFALVPQYRLWALDPENGRVAWTFAGPDGAGGTRDVAVAGDTVYAASALGWVSAVDGRTGQAFWSVDLEEAAWPPSVSDELVIYGTRGYFGVAPRDGPYGAGHVVALRRSDGNEVWRFPLPDSSGYMLSGGAVNGGVVWQDRVIVGGLSSHVYALRLADGELLWQKASGRSPPVASYRRLPVIVGETVVLPRHDNFVEARDVRTGDLLWTLDHSSLLMQASVVGDKVYLIDGSITIIDAQGHVWWQFGGGNVGGRSYWHGSVAPDGMIYTFCKEYLIYGRHTNICAIRPPVSP